MLFKVLQKIINVWKILYCLYGNNDWNDTVYYYAERFKEVKIILPY